MPPAYSSQIPAKDQKPNLEGRLVPGRTSTTPGLALLCFCQGCRESHSLPWPASLGPDETLVVDAPCREALALLARLRGRG
jgi:hypothetical protein